MATQIFGGLTAVILALSIWMGVKNNAEFDKQLAIKQDKERDLATEQGELADLQTLRDDTVAEKESTLTQNTEEGAALEKLEAEVASIQSDIDSREGVVSANQAKVDENNQILSGLPDPKVLVPEITATKNRIATLKADVKSSEDELASLTQQQEGAEALVASKREVIKYQSEGKSLPSLSTTVKTVYRNWGFVTLNGGNAQGVVPGSTLDVLRNGEVVAKLKVTAVEQNRAAADIVPDAVPVAIALRSGDRVVAEKAAQ